MKKLILIAALGFAACTKDKPSPAFSVTPTCVERSMKGRWAYFTDNTSEPAFAWGTDLLIDSVGVDSFTLTFPAHNERVGDTIVFSSDRGLCNVKNFRLLTDSVYSKAEFRVSYVGSSGDTIVDSVYYDGFFRYRNRYKKLHD